MGGEAQRVVFAVLVGREGRVATLRWRGVFGVGQGVGHACLRRVGGERPDVRCVLYRSWSGGLREGYRSRSCGYGLMAARGGGCHRSVGSAAAREALTCLEPK